jgi:hypothetical protein
MLKFPANYDSECPLSFETGGTMGYNCCFFLNFVPLHIESPYNFGGTGTILGVKNPLQRVNGHADDFLELFLNSNSKSMANNTNVNKY